jgi:hypothetical protein
MAQSKVMFFKKKTTDPKFIAKDSAKHPIAQLVYRWRIPKISAIHFLPGVYDDTC